MKELSIDQMAILSGGSWWADSICKAVFIGDIAVAIGVELGVVAALAGPAAWLIIGTNIACYVYANS